MDKWLYSLTEELFKELVLSIIEKNYICKGRPPKISHYQVFSAILYIWRTGVPWPDLPTSFGNWHTIHTRFNRSNERGLWWKILMEVQQRKKVTISVVLCDSSNFKLHRDGSGLKRGSNQRGKASWHSYQASFSHYAYLACSRRIC